MNDSMSMDPVQAEMREAFMVEADRLKARYIETENRLMRWMERVKLSNATAYDEAYRIGWKIDDAAKNIFARLGSQLEVYVPRVESWTRFSVVYRFVTGKAW